MDEQGCSRAWNRKRYIRTFIPRPVLSWQLTKHHLVHNIVQKIGYPTKSPDIRDSAALQQYYKNANISSTEFFKNKVSVVKFETKRQWSALGKPTDRDEWVSNLAGIKRGLASSSS